MITLQDVYDAFLSKVNEDEWTYGCTEEDLKWFLQDWYSFLVGAIAYFKFPRCSLEIDEETQSFKDRNMTSHEVQVLAILMKQEWLKRTIDSWENIKTQYEEHDFSQANLLSNFIKLKDQVTEDAKRIERIYYRSINKKPFQYRNLSGGRKNVRR